MFWSFWSATTEPVPHRPQPPPPPRKRDARGGWSEAAGATQKILQLEIGRGGKLSFNRSAILEVIQNLEVTEPPILLHSAISIRFVVGATSASSCPFLHSAM